MKVDHGERAERAAVAPNNQLWAEGSRRIKEP